MSLQNQQCWELDMEEINIGLTKIPMLWDEEQGIEKRKIIKMKWNESNCLHWHFDAIINGFFFKNSAYKTIIVHQNVCICGKY